MRRRDFLTATGVLGLQYACGTASSTVEDPASEGFGRCPTCGAAVATDSCVSCDMSSRMLAYANDAAVYETLTLAAPAGPVLLHNPTDSTNGNHWQLLYQNGHWTQGPPSDPQYIDDVRVIGINIEDSGRRADPSRPYFAWHQESKFYQTPTDVPSPLCENFLHCVSTTGMITRPIAWVGRWNGNPSGESCVFWSETISFNDRDGAPVITFDFADSQIALAKEGNLRWHKNNVPIILQRGSNGIASGRLPFVDGANRMVVGLPIVGDSASDGNLTLTNTAPAGSSVLQASASAASTANLFMSVGTATATRSAIIGTDTTGNLLVRQSGTTGTLTFDVNGTVFWRDKNTSYKKLLSLSPLAAAFGSPIRLPTFAVATLPSSLGVNESSALTYVSDAPGGPALAAFDGDNWRLVTHLGAIIT